MAQHGDLQAPIIDAHADERAKQPPQEAIREEREHERSLTGSPASATPHVNGPIEFVYPTGRAGDRFEGPLDLGLDAPLDLPPTRPRYRRLRGAGEVEEVGALGIEGDDF